MDNNNQQTPRNQVPPQYPLNESIVSNQRGKFILIIILVVLILMIGAGVFILRITGNKPTDTASQVKDKTLTTQPVEENNSKDVTTDEKIYYAKNGFSFYYPGGLELYQEYVGDATQWVSKSADRATVKDNMDALTLHESPNTLPAITTNGKYTIWNNGYFDARSEVTVTSVKEEPVFVGQDKTTLYTIECGSGCHYAVVRFSSNKSYYELIYNLNSGNISTLHDILASLSFFDPNAKDWKTYTSEDGGYSVQYPADYTVLEKVVTGNDGVRAYNSNSFKAIPSRSSLNVDTVSVYYEVIGNKTLDEYLNENSCKIIREKERFVLRGELAEYQKTICGVAGTSDVFVKHKDKLYIIGATSPNDPMLATFKFLD